MASVKVSYRGTLYHLAQKFQEEVFLEGEMYLSDYGVGGGPILPPPGSGGGGQPPGIWGPPGPWPTPPIQFPPGWVGGVPPGGWPPEGGDKPPGIWGPGDPRPQPPIAFPPGWVGGVPPGGWPTPPGPADENGFVKPPPPEGGWAYHQDYGWGLYPMGGGKPQPIPPPSQV